MRLMSDSFSGVGVHPGQCVLLFLGSFAPFHDGHLDAAISALGKARELGIGVSCLIFCLHNDKAVRSE